MEKNIFGLSLCAIALSGLMAVSCETETVYDVADVPSLTVSEAISVSNVGGTYTCTYSVGNPDENGIVYCHADKSWISDVTDKGNSISFIVAENSDSELRIGNIVITYAYTDGYVSQAVGVIQSAYEAPILTVQPTAVTAAYGGGTYSFTYGVENPAENGEVVCTTDADWISSAFDYSTYGTVSFTVDANDGDELRDCEIVVTYSYPDGSVSEAVAVVQDHPGKGGGNVSAFVGTYSCTGIVYNDDYYDDDDNIVEGQEPGVDSTWTMKIYDDGAGGLILDGLVPDVAGFYPNRPDYVAKASVSGSNIVVYPQFTGYVNNSIGFNLYDCWKCAYYASNEDPDLDPGWYGYSSDSFPCTFYYDPSTESWTSDYGMFLGLSLSSESMDDDHFYTFFDVFAQGMTFTKISDTTDTTATGTASKDSNRTVDFGDMVMHPVDAGLVLNTDYIAR